MEVSAGKAPKRGRKTVEQDVLDARYRFHSIISVARKIIVLRE
ncbi:MAG TPA: hypothetical protein VEF53_10985 [Patescibacteria group bacterium]|nr:hypothetical protein [Patescibacteria group bacterium]